MIVLTFPPSVIKKMNKTEPPAEVCLEVTDSADDHATSEGGGIWVGDFIQFLQERVRDESGDDFSFDHCSVDTDLFDEIEDDDLRLILIRFTNEVYNRWKKEAVHVPEWSDVAFRCREFCEDCDAGHEETEDVEGNTVRDRICDEDCDNFIEEVESKFIDDVTCDTRALQRMWNQFKQRKVSERFPPLHRIPPLHRKMDIQQTDIRQILSDNPIRDMLAEEDGSLLAGSIRDPFVDVRVAGRSYVGVDFASGEDVSAITVGIHPEEVYWVRP